MGEWSENTRILPPKCWDVVKLREFTIHVRLEGLNLEKSDLFIEKSDRDTATAAISA